MDKIRGVNLGNWLVLEKWMNPLMFEGTDCEDETWLCRTLPDIIKQERYFQHRSTYITERDFLYIAGQGLNAVRIPVPYFIFGDRDPFIGCIEFLDLAFNWAEAHGLQILIDLHTAPGSQNGFDNGGICGVCTWAQNRAEVEYVLHVLERLAERYRDRPGLWGLQVLNEPISERVWTEGRIQERYPPRDPAEAAGSGPIPTHFLKTFYREAYRRIRLHLPETKAVVFHDGFRLTEWDGYFTDGVFVNVVLDTHPYLMGAHPSPGEDPVLGIGRYIKENWTVPILNLGGQVPLIAGEWCIANSAAPGMKTKQETAEAYREIFKMQTDLFEKSLGWFFWSYKLLYDKTCPGARTSDGWDFGRCAAEGWIPERLGDG